MKSIFLLLFVLVSFLCIGQTLSDTTITATDYTWAGTDARPWLIDFVTDTINAEDDPDTLIINIPQVLGRSYAGYYAMRADTIPDTTALSAVLYVEELHSDPGAAFNTGSDYSTAAISTDSNAIPINGTWTSDTFAATTTFVRFVILTSAGMGLVRLQILLRPN